MPSARTSAPSEAPGRNAGRHLSSPTADRRAQPPDPRARALRLCAARGRIGRVTLLTRGPATPAAPPPGSSRTGPVRAALRRTAVPLGVLAAVAAAFGYVGAVDPNTPGHYPVCPLLHYTGVYCPGCGGLRSAYAVAHGHFRTALGCNALAVAGYAVFAVVWVVWAWRALRGRTFEPVLRPGALWALGALVLAFTIVRNLPFGTALVP